MYKNSSDELAEVYNFTYLLRKQLLRQFLALAHLQRGHLANEMFSFIFWTLESVFIIA